MNTHPHSHIQGSYKNYLIGFISSIALTLIAYVFVADNLLDGGAILYASLTCLCVAQVIIQLIFFLHLGEEPKPYWNTLVFSFMLLVLAILVIGTLWIMYNLNYNMMPSMTNGHIP